MTLWTFVTDWISAHSGLILGVSAGSLALLVATIVALPLVIARLPETYFRDCGWTRRGCGDRHPVAYWTQVVLSNIVGWFLILAGLFMTIAPGQGLLTMLLGLLLIDFRGRDRLIHTLVSHRTTWRAINWIRRRSNRPPFLPVRELG